LAHHISMCLIDFIINLPALWRSVENADGQSLIPNARPVWNVSKSGKNPVRAGE